MKKLMRRPGAIVFDLDDTLYPEVEYVRSGFGAVAGRIAGCGCEAEVIAEKLWRAFERGPRDRVFNAVLGELGLPEDEGKIAELVDVYRGHRPGLQLAAGVRELLVELKKECRLGIITDGYLPAQKLKVEALQIGDLFDHIIYTEELGREYWKPAGRAFELMAEELGCSASECVYVADNPAKDFIGPNQLGWQTIQVKLGQGVHGDEEGTGEGQAQYGLGNLVDLRSLLL